MIHRIDHINISVRDLPAVRDFFVDLGFEVIAGGPLGGKWIDELVALPGVAAEYVALKLPGTETSVELIRYDNPVGEDDPHKHKANQLGFRHIAFSVTDIEAEVARLSAKGVKFHSEIKQYKDRKRLAYFYGPEQIILELAEYRDYQDKPTEEPSPAWADAPRYCTSRAFPPYRYVTGLNHHPHEHPQGHSVDTDHYPSTVALTQDDWSDNDVFLFAIDLYHQAYFWEAHEAFESLWHAGDKRGDHGKFCKALIMLCAAHIKGHAQKWQGVHHLSRRGVARLEELLVSPDAKDGYWYGLNIQQLSADMKRYFGPTWEKRGELDGNPPRLILHAI